MKLSHVLILALSIVLGCGLIAVSNAALNRYEYSSVPVDGRLSRIDKMTGVVESYRTDRGWVDVRYP